MACSPLIVQSEGRKRIGLALTIWLQMGTVASWFLVALGVIHSLHAYGPRIRSYILDFYAKKDYVKILVYASDETCIEQAEPITANSIDPRWKLFKNCLGALDGTHIKIRVPIVDKPRYRTRKVDIATNMLGVCTPDMHFVYVIPSWENSIADGRVLRDAISRRHGLTVPHAELVEGLPSNVIDDDEPNIVNIHPPNAWATWRMELANQMFNEWQASRN
ncbi:hypothetical protein Goshw_000488 [Gossypium schwendimanii]|uniref:DDE Tnp4 domain-containing protein n=1 Tax=Gossypium schwendimanii TaxID=34291 RepID=A0A7J9NB80_GOSSC|nr:hypothetical protein [Gossypium schwendimanii]